ncbi:MAG: T9SS type A sorting domain-containing protein [Bacteroidia bacterium]|nr:T9SS type A sorting domain-containing protein [Bacteroidia bacterium]
MKNKKLLITILLTFIFISSAIAQVPNYVSANGLVGWWPFNGNADDESAIGNNGTVNGAMLTADRFGNLSSAYSFNGISDWISCGDVTILDSLETATWSWWMNTSDSLPRASGNDYVSVFRKNLAWIPCQFANDGYDYWHSIQFQGGVGSGELIWNTNTLDYATWNHFVLVKTASTISLYKNGALIQNINYNGLLPNSAEPLVFGMGGIGPGDGEAYNGIIDDIGIWNRALSQQEIIDLFNGTVSTPCVSSSLPVSVTAGMVAWYPFCGNAIDESGNGNNGTVNGAILSSDRFGNTNSAYFFPGDVNNKIVIQHDTLFDFQNSFSVSAWAKFDQSWSFHVEDIIYKGTFPFNSGWALAVNQDDAMYGVGNYSMIGALTTGSGAINTNFIQPFSFINTWRHLVLTYDGQYSRLFIDGALSDSILISSPILNNTSNIEIGGALNPVSGAFNRSIDDIGIWNRALAPDEITTLYTTGICFQTITVTDTLIINANFTGFNPVAYQNSIKVYPNPSNDHITIDCGPNYSTLNGYSMRIDNSIGQTVFNTPIAQQTYSIDLNTWTGNGLYLVYLLNSGGQVVDVRKIVIQ